MKRGEIDILLVKKEHPFGKKSRINSLQEYINQNYLWEQMDFIDFVAVDMGRGYIAISKKSKYSSELWKKEKRISGRNYRSLNSQFIKIVEDWLDDRDYLKDGKRTRLDD